MPDKGADERAGTGPSAADGTSFRVFAQSQNLDPATANAFRVYLKLKTTDIDNAQSHSALAAKFANFLAGN